MLDLTTEVMQKARLERDEKFNGKFYVAIKSTKIYCLPSCKARQSKTENVVFYHTKLQAKYAGYRGCKRCHSESYPFTFPPWVAQTKLYLDDHFNENLTDQFLADHFKIDSSTLRRKFKECYGKTPAEYQRELKLLEAKELLQEEHSISEIIYKSGFKSISGFRTAFKKKFGYNPKIGEENF